MRKLYLLLLFALVFAVFLPGISTSVYGGDSGDIILAAYFGGVAHPPGYPLNSIFGFLFTHLPFAGSIAYKAGIMMAVFSAGTIVFLFLTLEKLLKDSFIALATALTLAFSPLFWLYAHVVEVFQVNLFLVSVSVYLLIYWRSKVISRRGKAESSARKFLLLSFLFLGLATFHHHTSILVLPGFVFLIYKTEKQAILWGKNLFKLLGTFTLGILPYLYVPFAAGRATPVNWDNAVNAKNLIVLITRADYGTFAASQSFIGSTLIERVSQVLSFFAFLKNDFTLVGLFLVIAGLIFGLFKKDKAISIFLTISLILCGPFFLFYSSFSLATDFFFGIWERFILLSYFFASIFLGNGLQSIIFTAKKYLPDKSAFLLLGKKQLLTIVKFSIFLLPLYMIAANWHKSDMSEFKLGDWLGHDILVSSEANSIVFLFSDTLAFNSQYVYYSDFSEFGDRKVILGGLLRHPYYRKQLARRYPDLNFPNSFFDDSQNESGKFMADLVSANIDRFPIYTIAYLPEIKNHAWVKSGMMSKLVNNDNKDIANIAYLNRRALDNFKLEIDEANEGYTNFIEQDIKRSYNVSFNDTGDEMADLNLNVLALDNYNLALALNPESARSYYGKGKVYLNMDDCSSAGVFLLKSYEVNSENVPTLNSLADWARKCKQDESLAQDYELKAKIIKSNSTRETIF